MISSMTKSHKLLKWLRGARAAMYIVAGAMYIAYFVAGLSGAGWHRFYALVGFISALLGALLGVLLGVLAGLRRIQLDHQLVGVRAFQLRPEGVLSAITGRNDWTPGINEAQCVREAIRGSRGQIISTRTREHKVPQAGCHCGFNVHFSLDDLHQSDIQYDCAAVVEGWGRSRLHGNGWRSQYARILAIVDEEAQYTAMIDGYVCVRADKEVRPVCNRILLEAAAMRYNVPIITPQQAAQGLDEFGTAVPESVKVLVKK